VEKDRKEGREDEVKGKYGSDYCSSPNTYISYSLKALEDHTSCYPWEQVGAT
jgi:hypothetical protein